MKKLFLLLLFFMFASLAMSDSLKGRYPVCLSEKLYKQAYNAIIKEDSSEYEYLLRNGCYILTDETKITVLDISAWEGVAQIRVFAGEKAFVMWTSYKNIKRE